MTLKESSRSLERGEKEPVTFTEKLTRLWNTSSLCVGLDLDWSQIPGEFKRLGREEGTFQYGRIQIDNTYDLVCAFKPNIAFYEDSPEGEMALERLVDYSHTNHPYIPVIGDYKRGDIGNTNLGYIRSAFDRYKFDAVTVNPRFGQEALQTFLDRKEKGIIPVIRTSNPGSDEFQKLPVPIDAVAETKEEIIELYEAVGSSHMPAWLVELWRISRKWNINGNCAVVIGATHADELSIARKIAPHIPILLPGVGAQQADIQKTVVNGMSEDTNGMIINASRSVNFAKRIDKESQEEASRREATKLRKEINFYRENPEGFTEIQKEAADVLIDAGAIRFGDFKIKMHTKHPDAPLSPIYIDLRVLRSASRDAILKICATYGELLKDLKFDLFADVPTAITQMVGVLSHIYNIRMITPRLDKKTYGSGAKIDGIFDEGDKAVLIDDLITDGESKIKPVAILRNAGIEVSDVVTLIDREQGGKDALSEHGLNLHTAFSISNLLRYYKRTGKISESLYQRCMDYFVKFN